MEGFERNKNLWVGVMVGVVVFFVALMFRGVFLSGDEAVLARGISRAQGLVRDTAVPPSGATARLQEKLDRTQAAFAQESGVIAETKAGTALALASIRRVLTDIGRTGPNEVGPFEDLLAQAPNACFSRLYDEVRRHFRSKSNDRDVLFSQELGLDGLRFEVDEIDRVLHALSVAVHAVNVAIEAGVVEVNDMGVALRASGRGADDRIESDDVVIKVLGPPSAIAELINRMNDPSRFVAISDAEIGGADRRAGSGGFREEQNVPFVLKLKALRVTPLAGDEES